MEDKLIVGEILKPQGIRGELKVRPFTDSAEDFKKFKRVFLDDTEYRVLSVRIGEDAVYVALKGVPDRNAAELLRGKSVVLLREDAPELEEGRYYIVDLLGSKIVTTDGIEVGEVIDIRSASTDVYTVKTDKKEILFPAVKGLIEDVDLENKVITVNAKRFLEVAVLD